ncbi:MAG: flagellar hook-length control protein FliK [Nitrospira sp.]|nr:flagellar hook-length control protein FliK [Nitrospira sp.]
MTDKVVSQELSSLAPEAKEPFDSRIESRAKGTFSSALRSAQRLRHVSNSEARQEMSASRLDEEEDRPAPAGKVSERSVSESETRLPRVGRGGGEPLRECGDSKGENAEAVAAGNTAGPLTEDRSELMCFGRCDVRLSEPETREQREHIVQLPQSQEMQGPPDTATAAEGTGAVAMHQAAVSSPLVFNLLLSTEDGAANRRRQEGGAMIRQTFAMPPAESIGELTLDRVWRSDSPTVHAPISDTSHAGLRTENGDQLSSMEEQKKVSPSERVGLMVPSTAHGGAASARDRDGAANRVLQHNVPWVGHRPTISSLDQDRLVEGPRDGLSGQPEQGGIRFERTDQEDDAWAAPKAQRESTIPVWNEREYGGSRSEMAAAAGPLPQPTTTDQARRPEPMPGLRLSIHHPNPDATGPILPRSVAFEVAGPDFGHINVRVAVRNDLVHAYLSSDRLDVAHYLAAGHDRLQSALQATGLEMGQFRVDIDRHNAGRSFHQGGAHDQGRTWQSEKFGWEQRPHMSDPSVQVGPLYAGLLNIVA